MLSPSNHTPQTPFVVSPSNHTPQTPFVVSLSNHPRKRRSW